MIALRGDALTVGYRRRRRLHTIVTGVNVQVHTGEFVVLIGQNGTGKSTLLRTLAGLQAPLSGTVQIADSSGSLMDLHRLDARSRAARLGVVLTERPDLPALTAREVIGLGRTPYTDWLGRLTDDDRAAVAEAIDAVEAHAIADQPYAELSDGQRQRVLIGRALAQEPAVIVLDEPTAFMDVTRRIEITRLLRDLAHRQGRAILASTHDLDLALRFADRLWVLHDGVLTDGLPAVLAADGTIERALPGAFML